MDMREIKDYTLIEGVTEAKDKGLDGLIVKGYETKFGVVNANGEMYDAKALDRYVKELFVAKGRNMAVDINHSTNVDDIVGRVTKIEVNDDGYYFEVYIPRSLPRYNLVKALLDEGILQGFSKFGWVTDFDVRKAEDGSEYLYIKEMMLTSVSLVTLPANDVKFDSADDVKNELVFENKMAEAEEKNFDSRKKNSILRCRN